MRRAPHRNRPDRSGPGLQGAHSTVLGNLSPSPSSRPTNADTSRASAARAYASLSRAPARANVLSTLGAGRDGAKLLQTYLLCGACFDFHLPSRCR